MTTTLNILTWNIWMMPALSFQSPSNEARSLAIASEILARDFDLVCFEKAFDSAARAALKERLGERYPFRYGPLNNGSLKLNGGVWVFSKVKLKVEREIEFRDSVGLESACAKGAMLLSGAWEGRRFQIIGTHLQGEVANQHVRDKQIAQIADELVVPLSEAAVPLFICGDFGTERRDPKDPFAESKSYTRMLALFQAVNGPEHRVTLDDRPSHNDLAMDKKGRMVEVDYILLRASGQPMKGDWRVVRMIRKGWEGKDGRQDLSYHYAVAASFELP